MNEKRKKSFAGIVLFLSVLLIFYFTIIIREPFANREYIFCPFHSYMQIICEGEYGWIKQNLLNIALFIPFGFGYSNYVARHTLGKKYLCTVGVGFLLSLFIELTQYIFKLGFFETDDLINNTLGSLLGEGIYVVLRYIRTKGKDLENDVE